VGMLEPVWNVQLLKADQQDFVERRTCGRFYRFILAAETWLTSLFVSRIKEHRRRVPASRVRPLGNPAMDSYDLVVNLTRGPIKPNRLPASQRGVLNVQYGNIRTGIEGPAGFWESCHEDNATGCWMTLQLPQSEGSPACVFSARYKTKRTMCMNTESVLREGHIDIGNELLRLATDAPFRTIDLSTEPVWTCPGPFDVIFYRLRTLWREVRFAVTSRLLGRDLVFSIGTVDRHWSEANLTGAGFIPNPEGSYLADPFIVERDGRSVVYAEEFDLKSDRGRISWLELGDEADSDRHNATYRGTLIEEPYHMSFPFVFEHGNELYMVPETFEAREVSLYRCVRFPDQWERCGTLMDEVEASDTMLFRDDGTYGHPGRWWMLTNLRPEGALDFYSRLYLFWSEDPTSADWTPHPLNPVLIDAEGGRNGGLLHGADGRIHRVGQIQSIMKYGAGWTISRLLSARPDGFSEETVASVYPSTSTGVVGGHHIHGTQKRTVFDILHPRRR